MSSRVVSVILGAACCVVGARAAEPLVLRMERELAAAPAVAGTPDESLLRFGVSDLRRRVERQRALVEQARAQNERLREALRLHEDLIADLRSVDRRQEVNLAASRRALAAEATAAPTPPVATRPEANPAAAPATAPPGFVLTRGPVVAALTALVALLLLAVALLHRRSRQLARAAPAESPGVVGTPAAASPAAQKGPAPPTWPPPAPPRSPSRPTLAVVPPRAPDDAPEPSAESPAAPAAEAPGSDADSPPAAAAEAPTGAAAAPAPYVIEALDKLIAAEHFERAESLLNELLRADPENPEYLLRHYFARTRGGQQASSDDEALLRAMMGGPLATSMLRVRDIGRKRMPGKALLEVESERDEVRKLLGTRHSPSHDADLDSTLVKLPDYPLR